jgi:hypothetical protein
MRRTIIAASISVVVIGLAAITMYTMVPQGVAVILHLIAMLTAGFIHELSPFTLGKWVNGFFISNTAGFVTAGIVGWLLLFLLLRLLLPRGPGKPR